MTERKFDDFDAFANDYRDIHTKNVKLSGADSYYFAAHKVKEVKKQEAAGELQLLDLGCGDGVTAFFFNKEFPSWKLEGIDISEKSIETAIGKNIPATHFQLYSGTAIPFADNSFDIVFVAAVFHHIDFSLHQKLMNEIYRVLKPAGRFYIFEHNPLNPVTRHLVNTCVFDKDAKLLFSGYTRKLLRETGFKKIKVKYILFFPRKGILSRMIPLEAALSWLPLGGQYYFRCEK